MACTETPFPLKAFSPQNISAAPVRSFLKNTVFSCSKGIPDTLPDGLIRV